MINKPTVFVLGAGAHKAYNFPTGEELKEKVGALLRNAKSRDDGNDLKALIRLGHTGGKGFSYEECAQLGNQIDASGQRSIDLFLNNNSHINCSGVLGKAAISQVLIKYENSIQAGGASKDDWLSYLFGYMANGIRTAGLAAATEFVTKNKVSFVTFNYDRFLERWWHSRLQASYGLTFDEALECSRKIDICHVFGMLGDYPPPSDPVEWLTSTRRIKLIHEAEEKHSEAQKARAILSRAQVLGILGFGYHEENISLVGLADAVKVCKYVASSRNGFTDVAWERRTRMFPADKIKIGREEWQCKETLDNMSFF
jgi:hypothetical protein